MVQKVRSKAVESQQLELREIPREAAPTESTDSQSFSIRNPAYEQGRHSEKTKVVCSDKTKTTHELGGSHLRPLSVAMEIHGDVPDGTELVSARQSDSKLNGESLSDTKLNSESQSDTKLNSESQSDTKLSADPITTGALHAD